MQLHTKTSESVINNLLHEVDKLTIRVKYIKASLGNTICTSLKDRLMFENQAHLQRLSEIQLIAKRIEGRNFFKFGLSSLLVEKCYRSIKEAKFKKDLFFL